MRTLSRGIGGTRRDPAGKRWRRFAAAAAVTLALIAAMATPASAATPLPVLWTAGGLDSGNTGAGNAARIAADGSGNVAVVSGPALGRDLAVTSYTATGSLRWRSSVSPSTGTFRAGWVVAAPNGDFVAVGYTVDSHGFARGSTLVRYASNGTLRWRVDLVALVSRLVVDTGGNTYVVFGAQDVQLQKYNANGVLLWATGATGTFSVSSLALSPDETDVVMTGSIVGGASWMTASFNTATGARRWQVVASEGTAALDVVVDATRVYVTGRGNVGIDGFLTVVAYDRATGARLWRTDANPPTCCAIGERIALAPDGSLVVAGHTATGGYFDWWIVAMNPNGAVRWKTLRNDAVAGDEFPAAVFVLAGGTTVVSGTGGPVTRDILGNSYMRGVTAGYSPDGTLLWEAFARLPTVWATPLPNGDVCATGGYDALVTCWRVPGVVVSNRPPTAVMSATPSTGAAPLTVTFDGRGSTDPDGTATSWAWSFGDGAVGSGALITHVYSSPGTYTASLTVTDNGGASSRTTGSIVVSAPSTPTAPRNLTASPLSRSSIGLTWTDGATAQTTITIERCKGSGCTNFIQVVVLPGTAVAFTDSGLAARTTYTYRVRAHNASGDSPYSNTASARTRR